MAAPPTDPGARADIGHTPAAADFGAVRDAVHGYWSAHAPAPFDPADPIVRLHEPTFGPDEVTAALECLLTTRVTMGPKVIDLETMFAADLGSADGVMSNSGSSANLLAIAALANPAREGHLEPGDEVIVSALSWSTTVWPLVQHGLVPVVVDIDPATWNIDPAAAEAAIGPRTRAIMPVHVYGNPCDMDALTALCEQRDLLLIEDCCEALGAAYDGTPVGRFGVVGTFSFYFSHHISTLEGGITVSDDVPLAELMRILRAHGWVRDVKDPAPWLDGVQGMEGVDPRFVFVNSGYNLRPTELAGAMGQLQLPKLTGFVDARRANRTFYAESLADHADVLTPQAETPKGHSSWFGYGMTIAADAPFDVTDIRRHLAGHGIESRPIICGNIARQPAMGLHEHRVAGDLGHADVVMDRAFSIGNHQSLDDAARSHVVTVIDDFVRSRT